MNIYTQEKEIFMNEKNLIKDADGRTPKILERSKFQ